jgi:hypothetical protein
MNDDLPPVQIEYASPTPGKNPSTARTVVLWVIVGLFGLGALSVFSRPSFTRTRGPDNRVKCASNLRQIGQAILLYTNDFKGRYPDNFGDLLLTQDITSAVFDCPTTNDTPAVGPTTQAAIVNMATPGHCSYIYVGKGLTMQTVQPTMVVAYEPPANHGNAGMNVLFGDGARGVYCHAAGAVDSESGEGGGVAGIFPAAAGDDGAGNAPVIDVRFLPLHVLRERVGVRVS